MTSHERHDVSNHQQLVQQLLHANSKEIIKRHYRSLVNSPNNWSVMRNIFSYYDVIMIFRLFWNRMTILLSVAINCLMLATWNARAALQDGNNNDSFVDPNLYEWVL